MMVVIGGYGSGRRTFVCEKLGFTLTDIGTLSDTSCAVLFIDKYCCLSFCKKKLLSVRRLAAVSFLLKRNRICCVRHMAY